MGFYGNVGERGGFRLLLSDTPGKKGLASMCQMGTFRRNCVFNCHANNFLLHSVAKVGLIVNLGLCVNQGIFVELFRDERERRYVNREYIIFFGIRMLLVCFDSKPNHY